MDFGYSEDQQALRGLAKRIFKEQAGAAAQWKALSEAELLGMCLPVEVGGSGLGEIELSLLYERAGYAASEAPLWGVLSAALAVARFGTEAQRTWARKVAEGAPALSIAFSEPAGDPARPMTRAVEGRLTGVKTAVPAADEAERLVVSAEDGLYLVDPAHAVLEAQVGTDDRSRWQLTLEDTPGERLGGAEALRWTLERAHLGLCALSLGMSQSALHMTAKYASEREQFGMPIGTFQAVTQRMGDAYVDVESMRLTTQRAAYLLSTGQDAESALAVARVFASEAGHRVVLAAQHIHAGVGFDRDYPLYRYFLGQKQLEFTLGSASAQLARLGDLLA